MAVDQEQTFLYDLDGQPRAVARGAREKFEQENPGATRVRLFSVDGRPRAVAADAAERFASENPGAEPVYLFDRDGLPQAVAKSGLGRYIGERAAPDKDRSLASYAGEAYADARRKAADTAKAVGNAAGKVVEGTGDVLGRVPANLEALGDRIVAGPLLLAGRVADAVNPDPLAGPVDVLTGRRGRYSPQEMGYEEDPYRQGLASRTADKARAWLARRDEARAPKTAAGRVADVPVSFATQAVGYVTPAGPLMMVGNAAQAGDRAYAEGASGAEALGRTALSLGAQAAAFGPKPIPVPGANAAGRAVEGAAARIGGRLAQTPEGAARAVRTAVTAGQVARGAVESGARMAGVTAAEGGDAKEIAIAGAVGGVLGGTVRGVATRPLARAAGEAAGRMAGSLPRGGVDTPPPRMDPAGLAANRAAATTRTPEGDTSLAEANRAIAARNAGALPRVPAEIPPAVRVPDAVRGYVPPAERALGDREAAARRSAEEELAPAEVPQVPVDEVPPTVPPEARGGVETPPPAPVPAPAPVAESGAAPGEASRPGEPQSQATAPVAAKVSEWADEYLARHERARRNADKVIDPVSGRTAGAGLPITEHEVMQRSLRGILADMGADELAALEKSAASRSEAARAAGDAEAGRIWNQVSYQAGAEWRTRALAPVAESATPPRRVTGRPRELSTMHGNGNSTTLATVKNRAEKGVLPVEIVVRPNGMGVSRAGQFDANEPVVLFRYEGDGADSLGYPIFGNTERILEWAKESGLADRAGVSTVEPAPVAKAATPPRAKRTRKPKAASTVAVSTTQPAGTMTGPVASSDPATQAAALRGMADRSDALVARFDEWAKTPEGRKAVREEADAKDAFQKASEAVNRAQRNLDKTQSDSVKYPSDGEELRAAKDELNRAWTDYSIALGNWNAAAARVGRPLDAGSDLRGRADRIGEEPLPGRPEGAGAGRAVVEKDDGVPVIRGEGLPTGATVREQMPQQREWLKDAVKVAANQAFEGKRTGAKSTKGANVSALYDTNIPKGIPPKVRIEIPGDGKFTLVNEKHVIEEWGKRMDQALAPSGLARPSIPTGAASSRGEAKPAKNAPGSFARPDATKLLAPFASKDDARPIMNEPFGDGEFAYATDGRYFARLRSRGEPFKKKGAKSEVDGLANGLNTYLNAERNLLGDFDVASALRNVREMIASGDGKPVVVGIGRDGELAFATLATEYGDAAGAARAGEFSPTGEQIGVFNPEYFATILELAAKTGNARIELGRPVKGDPILLVRGTRGNMDAGLMPFQGIEGGPEGMARRIGSELGELSARTSSAPSSGSARGDVAADTPRLAGTAAGVKPATPDGPRAAIRSELQVLLDSGEKDPATLEDLARRAEAADAFATAALARQAAGTYRGTPWGTEGGAWPSEEPPAARATVGDLVQLAKAMGDGSAPAVMRRIARHPSWAGVFRGEEGVPESGRIGIITKMARLVDDSQKARIREEAARKAAETGEDHATVYASMMVRAIRENAAAGPKPLQAVLAHEIGHFLDFLDEGTLKRGNVLGHLAALKKYMARTLFPTKAAADAAGAPGLTASEVKAAEKEWKVPESEARRRLMEERDLLAHPEIRREMESLVAWFRQTDGAPDYFRNDPAELYAEAFSAWVNYPAETARRAPEFAAALEGWMDARPQAAKALEEFRSGVTQRAARAAVERGDTTDPAFFAAQEREAEAARWWQRRKAAAVANLRPQTARQRVKAFGDALRVSLTGPLNVIRSDLMASGAGQAFRPENLPLWRAMRQAENAPNLAALWDYRFKAFVEPELEGAPYTAFLNYLKHYRIATELLGKDLDRGRMNLPNPGGVTPGDITRDGVNQSTSSAAWIHALQRDQPELYAKLERARKAFWEKVRNGRDDLGGDGSPMQVVRDTHVLSKEQKEQLLGNEGYVSFSEKDLPDPSRRMGSEEQSLWDGIFSQRTGTFKEPGDVVANTIRGDYNLMRRLNQMELALQTVDWLRANKPELVGGQAETKMDPATGRLYVEQGTKPGMRTVSFLRDGKPEGWYVPVAYAEAVEMPGRGERSWDGIMGALSKVKRGLNAMQTSWNPVFNTNNSWAKDPHSLALRLPNWRVRGHGALGGTARALGNVFGHYGEQLASYLDNSGRDYARGKYNPDTARALAWGAVNNAAPGSTAYADAQGGGVGVLEGRLRDRGLEGQTLDDAARRQILKARGLTEEQIDAGLRSAEGTLEKWAKAWDSMGSVARGARLLYPRLLSQLQHGEIRTKSYALRRILAERPDLSREEAVEIARQQIGTPDMANKPAIDRSPLLGATLFQYFTPRVHGWVDQLVGAMRRGWTGGTKEQATKFTRLVALTAAMSVPFFILRDAIQTYRHAEEEEVKARARGDLAAAERFAEEKEKARARARSIQAISSRDLFTKVFAFAGDGRALGFSVDPTVTPITTAVLGSLFGREWGVKPGDALREGVGTEILPGFAPLFTAAWGNLRGFDPNTGRPIGGGEDADLLDRLSWTAETLTGRALGTGAFSYARELAAPKDDAKSEERRSRQDVPILSAAWRPFWRKTGYGLVERAAAMREKQRQVDALVGAIAERYARGQPVSEEDARWFAQHAAQPGESVQAAAERVWKLRNMTPDQRAVDSLSRRSRREIEEEFGYIPPPPRLTDEDRAR